MYEKGGMHPSSQDIAAELYDPENVTRIQRFAFPEHDEQGFGALCYFPRDRDPPVFFLFRLHTFPL